MRGRTARLPSVARRPACQRQRLVKPTPLVLAVTRALTVVMGANGSSSSEWTEPLVPGRSERPRPLASCRDGSELRPVMTLRAPQLLLPRALPSGSSYRMRMLMPLLLQRLESLRRLFESLQKLVCNAFVAIGHCVGPVGCWRAPERAQPRSALAPRSPEEPANPAPLQSHSSLATAQQ